MSGGSKLKSTAPRVVICDDADQVAVQVAEFFAEAVRNNPRIVLGLATGGTPVGAYRELIRLHQEQGIDFRFVSSFNLDEYVGLGPDHPQSYRYFMQQQLFRHLNIDPLNTHVPDGRAENVSEHAQQYEDEIEAAGGIDLQLLGIGSNGHIAFNEPGSTVDSPTRQVDLTDKTIADNARFFDSIDQVPRTAITMGIGTILRARQIVLMATGESKAAAVQQAVCGPPDPQCPASLLHHHPNVTFFLDRAAASRLES